ncbi:MAG: class I SAM-dependent methyltransferase [Anaerolineales bacterium]|nr:class I SAM-dependent methyltransferase [Anaerolineales bacterium]
MNADTANDLLTLNQQFYQTFAAHFSATRQRLQPGVQRILERLASHTHLLDLGCGNGELWRVLARRGFEGLYVGLDFSPLMLQQAAGQASATFPASSGAAPAPGQRVAPSTGAQAVFLQADLGTPGWGRSLPPAPYSAILAFAVLHHLPGRALRLQTLRQARDLLAPGGYFYHSEWQFLNSPRLSARIQDWSLVGLSANQVDSDDYLLDWRHGGHGLRYVHHFSEAELAALAEESSFHILETFQADGEGGKLGLYQVWKAI